MTTEQAAELSSTLRAAMESLTEGDRTCVYVKVIVRHGNPTRVVDTMSIDHDGDIEVVRGSHR